MTSALVVQDAHCTPGLRRPRTMLAMNPGVARKALGPDGPQRLATVTDLDPRLIVSDLSAPGLDAVLGEIEVLVTHWGCPVLDAAALDRLPSLRAIVHGAGSVKGFVTDAVWQRGIRVSSAAWANALPVAEYTLAMILMANKQLWQLREDYRAERGRAVDWHQRYLDAGNYRRTIGIIGASQTGRRVIELLRPYEFDLVVFDPFLTAVQADELGVRKAQLDELCATSDVISLHAPALPETRHMLDRGRLALIRDGATVINTARGSLIDGAALEAELTAGRLQAVIDVTEPEVLPAGSPLYDLPNVVLTPHIAGSLGNEMQRLFEVAFRELRRYAAGLDFAHPVSQAELERSA